MSPYTESVGPVDIIFAGGGTAACVAAGRERSPVPPQIQLLEDVLTESF